MKHCEHEDSYGVSTHAGTLYYDARKGCLLCKFEALTKKLDTVMKAAEITITALESNLACGKTPQGTPCIPCWEDTWKRLDTLKEVLSTEKKET